MGSALSGKAFLQRILTRQQLGWEAGRCHPLGNPSWNEQSPFQSWVRTRGPTGSPLQAGKGKLAAFSGEDYRQGGRLSKAGEFMMVAGRRHPTKLPQQAPTLLGAAFTLVGSRANDGAAADGPALLRGCVEGEQSKG